jgi:hypothetical protein
MNQTYHLEALGFAGRSGSVEAVQRLSIRSDSLERVRQRAVKLLQRSQTPQWNAGRVEAVRVLDGAGSEVFRWTLWDEMSGATHP